MIIGNRDLNPLVSGLLLISDLTEWFECRSEDITLCKSLEATPNQMMGGAAVGNIPTESSYFGKCCYYACTFISWSAGGTGDHRISFDPTSRFLDCIMLQPQKLFFLLRTWYHLQGEEGT